MCCRGGAPAHRGLGRVPQQIAIWQWRAILSGCTRKEISSHSQGGVGARVSVHEGVGIVKSYSMSNGNSKDPILAQKSEKLGG